MSELNLILLGPPGAGKGTQAERLVGDFDLPYFATGDILRAAVKEESDLGKEAKEYMDKGDLVPDDLISRVIMERVDSPGGRGRLPARRLPAHEGPGQDARGSARGPRPSLSAALLIDVDDDVVIKRLSGRRVCSKNGHNYHVDFDPPKREGVCDQDGSKLIQRDDDKPETVKHRLDVYHEQTQPLVEHYDEKGILKRFDGTRAPGEVHDHIRATVATMRLEEQV